MVKRFFKIHSCCIHPIFFLFSILGESFFFSSLNTHWCSRRWWQSRWCRSCGVKKVVFLLVVSSSTISSSSLLTDTTKQSRECADVTVGSNLEKIFDVFVRNSSASVYVVGLYMTSTPTFYDDANFLCISATVIQCGFYFFPTVPLVLPKGKT